MSAQKEQQIWVSIRPGILAKWTLAQFADGKQADLKIFLREVGVERFQTQDPSFWHRILHGWIRAPQGSCVKINLAAEA
jgi:hypothetical protein